MGARLTANVPHVGFCGFGNSGKTTLLEKLTSRLASQGLTVGYFKHDAHRFDIDREGKDTDRLFKSGTEGVLITSPAETAVRLTGNRPAVAEPIFAECDIVLVEGYKDAPWEKVWVHPHSGKKAEMPVLERIIGTIGKEGDFPHDDIEGIARFVVGRLENAIQKKPIYGGLLIGGKSERMGTPKALMPAGEVTCAEKIFALLTNACDRAYLLGTGPLPPSLQAVERIADDPRAEGPIAGILSAHRFAPHADWLFLAVDMPEVTPEYFQKLVAKRKSGWRAAMARSPESGYEPLCALYSAQLLSAMQRGRDNELSLNRLLKKLGVVADETLYDANILAPRNRPEDLK